MMTKALKQLVEGISTSIAMAADQNLVGVDGDVDDFERWSAALHEAVDDGLEMAERRAGGFDE